MMERFHIQFVGLKPGKHTYQYLIEDDFFEKRDYSIIRKARVEVEVILDKQDYSMKFDFHMKGMITLPCDRCNEELDLPVEGDRKLIVKLAGEDFEDNDELVMLPRNESEIDLSQYIYEFINLLLPLRVVHGNDAKGVSKCDKDVLAKLAAHSIGEPQTDARWDILKKINLQ